MTNHHVRDLPAADPATILTSFRVRLRADLDLATVVADLVAAAANLIGQAPVALWLHPALVPQTPDGPPAGKRLPAIPAGDPILDAVGKLAGLHAGVALDAVGIASPFLSSLRGQSASLAVPLIAGGHLVGLLTIGGEATDSRALDALAVEGALALRAAALTRREQELLAERDTEAEERRVASEIQRRLLPRELPALPGWRVAIHYQPARVVGGDLYDFVPLPGDLLGLVFGDASDKSIPAAMMMAAARTLLRAAAQRLVLPGQVLAQVNDALCAQLPPGAFVTCLYAILDPASGRLRYANAGQLPPYRCGPRGTVELRARGWPLGMMPGVTYDEQEAILAPGDRLLCYSDGLVETHNPERAMFGAPRLEETLDAHCADSSLLDAVRAAHAAFAGPNWDQEDDLTLVAIERNPGPNSPADGGPSGSG